jgi:hypothetical protein
VTGPGPSRSARTLAGSLAALAAGALVPAPASAHGLVQRADLPIPEVFFAWGSAIVLVVSFAALALLWPAPRLERVAWRPLPVVGRALGSRTVELLCGACGTALLLIVLWAGFAGPDGPLDNLAPTFILVIFWVGVVFLSVMLGDVYRAFNPWRAIGRATGWALARVRGGRAVGHPPYPDRLGRWPAAAGLLAFTWIELVGVWGDRPRTLVTAAVAYTVVQFAGMARFGVEPWISRAEAFAVYFNLFARLSVVETRERVVGVRPPLGGLPGLSALPGTVAVVCVMIGSVTFDGFSQGTAWKEFAVDLTDGLTTLGVPLDVAPKVAGTFGLLLGVTLVSGFYALGIGGARSVGGSFDAERLRVGFVHTLVPIAMVYAAAHYLTALVFQGQAIAYLASDPVGRGWDLFGTASTAIDYSVISQNGTWYAQVGLVVLGHVAALTLAHDRALALYGQARLAVRSQYWMLGVMVGFTTLALWLLAQANA